MVSAVWLSILFSMIQTRGLENVSVVNISDNMYARVDNNDGDLHWYNNDGAIEVFHIYLIVISNVWYYCGLYEGPQHKPNYQETDNVYYCPVDARTIQFTNIPLQLCTHYCVSEVQCSILSYHVNKRLCLLHKKSALRWWKSQSGCSVQLCCMGDENKNVYRDCPIKKTIPMLNGFRAWKEESI